MKIDPPCGTKFLQVLILVVFQIIRKIKITANFFFSKNLLQRKYLLIKFATQKYSTKKSTSTSTSTLFNKNIDYNRLYHKIAIANLGGPVKRKIIK